ncbi:hypothetical protein GCM10010468_55030 [Actinocorallia longicatena]|uniref:Uncharacterized protein n=1 Tax=Actinocorallia longicatena TaxID=111803 RepID=A0ABP6QFI6_9ACTN
MAIGTDPMVRLKSLFAAVGNSVDLVRSDDRHVHAGADRTLSDLRVRKGQERVRKALRTVPGMRAPDPVRTARRRRTGWLPTPAKLY